MRGLKQCLALAAAVAAFLLPSYAAAAAVVPPGNSAVNQYTQTFPTSEGEVEVHGKEIRAPSQVLGHKAAHKLDQQGTDGKAAAELAASTSTPGSGGGGGGGGPAGGGTAGGGAGGSNGAGSGSGHTGSTASPANSGADGSTGTPGSGPDGSSGIGQVLGQATGASSSGDLGLLLPLVTLAALLWCTAYFWRQRRPV